MHSVMYGTTEFFSSCIKIFFLKLTHWCLRSSQKCDRLGKPTKRSAKCCQTPKAKSTSSVEIAASSSNDNMASVRIHWLCWNLWETRAWGWCSILMGTSVRPPIKGHWRVGGGGCEAVQITIIWKKEGDRKVNLCCLFFSSNWRSFFYPYIILLFFRFMSY